MKTGRALEKEYADKFAAARKIINVTCRHYKTKKDVIISIVERSYLKAQDKALEQDEKQKRRNEQYFILSFFDALKIEANRASYCKSIYEYAAILCLSRFLVWIETDVDTYYRMAKELFDFSNLLVVTEVNKGGQNDTNKECGTLV